MRVRFGDDLGRLRSVEEAPTRGEKTFFHRLDHVLGKRVFVTRRARGRGGGSWTAPGRAGRGGAARATEQGVPSPPVVRDAGPPSRSNACARAGMDSGFTWGGKVNDDLDVPRGWFGVYWYDRGPTTPEGLEAAIREYERTGDFASLTVPDQEGALQAHGRLEVPGAQPQPRRSRGLRTLADVSRTAARNKAVYNMDYYFVGDEGSLTSYADPVDFCFGSTPWRTSASG